MALRLHYCEGRTGEGAPPCMGYRVIPARLLAPPTPLVMISPCSRLTVPGTRQQYARMCTTILQQRN